MVIAQTGEDALRLLAEEGPFAAMLLDLGLPDMDGLDVLRQCAERLHTMKVVVTTGDASLTRAIEAMRLGAFEFLVKPAAGKRLVSVMESAVAAVADTPEPEPAAVPVHTLSLIHI